MKAIQKNTTVQYMNNTIFNYKFNEKITHFQ